MFPDMKCNTQAPDDGVYISRTTFTMPLRPHVSCVRSRCSHCETHWAACCIVRLVQPTSPLASLLTAPCHHIPSAHHALPDCLPPTTRLPSTFFVVSPACSVTGLPLAPLPMDCSSCIPQAASHVASPGQVMLGCGRQSLCSDCGLHADTAAECRL